MKTIITCNWKRAVILLGMMILLSTTLLANPPGRVEARLGYITDSLRESGGYFVHMERIQWGIDRQLDLWDMNYSIALGGLIRYSSVYTKTQIVPEYQLRSQFHPVGSLDVSFFSYAQLRNPMQILQDSLQHREQVHGFQVRSPLPGDGTASISLGVRNSDRETATLSHQFFKLGLEEHLFGMRFRIQGEIDLYDSETVTTSDRSHLSLQWYGSPVKGLSWTALNSYFHRGENAYWQIYQRANYRINDRSTLWAHITNGLVVYETTDILRRAYDLDYRWKMTPAITLQLLSKGNRVSQEGDDPVYHWRSYLGGAIWQFGKRNHAAGLFQTGLKESYRFGKGLDALFETRETMHILNSKALGISLNDYILGEFFMRLDGVEDVPRYDIDHQVQMDIRLWPGHPYQIGNTLRLNNHFGTDLDFSTDTLRNAITHDMYFKWIRKQMRVSLNHLTISELGDNDDLRLHVNLRLTYRLGPGLSFNMMSMYRYKSELYPEYLWLNGFVKVSLPVFDWALDIQAQGEPENAFKQDVQLWMRVMRQL